MRGSLKLTLRFYFNLNDQAYLFVLFSAASAVFGLIIVILYTMTIASQEEDSITDLRITQLLIVGLGTIEFFLGIPAIVSMRLKDPSKCCFCTPSQQVNTFCKISV